MRAVMAAKVQRPHPDLQRIPWALTQSKTPGRGLASPRPRAAAAQRSIKPKCGPTLRRTRFIAERAVKASTAIRARRESCDGRAATLRNIAGTFGRPSGRMSSSAAGGTARWAGSTTTRSAANARSCRAATRATICDSMSTTAAPVAPIKLALLCWLGDRQIDAEDRRVNGAVDETEKLARPHRVGSANRLRLPDGGCHDPVARPQMRSKTAGDTEADQPAIALTDGSRRRSLRAHFRRYGRPPARRARQLCAPRNPARRTRRRRVSELPRRHRRSEANRLCQPPNLRRKFPRQNPIGMPLSPLPLTCCPTSTTPPKQALADVLGFFPARSPRPRHNSIIIPSRRHS